MVRIWLAVLAAVALLLSACLALSVNDWAIRVLGVATLAASAALSYSLSKWYQARRSKK